MTSNLSVGFARKYPIILNYQEADHKIQNAKFWIS